MGLLSACCLNNKSWTLQDDLEKWDILSLVLFENQPNLWLWPFSPPVFILKIVSILWILTNIQVKFLVCPIVMLKRRLLLVVISLWQCQGTSFSSPSLINCSSQGKRENISAKRWKPGLSFSPWVDCIAKPTGSFPPDFYSQLATQVCDRTSPPPYLYPSYWRRCEPEALLGNGRRRELSKKWLL